MERFGWSAEKALDGVTAAFLVISLRQAGFMREACGPGLAFIELSEKIEAAGLKPGDAIDLESL